MTHYIERGITIRAPRATVFRYLSNPENDPKWLPALMEVHGVEGEGRGQRYEWTYKMAGVKLYGVCTVVEDLPHERHRVRSEGGARSDWAWDLRDVDEGTAVSLRLEYELPAAVAGRIAEKLLIRQNEHEADEAMANLQARCEALARLAIRSA